MKKIVVLLIFVVCYFQKYEFVDLKRFESETIKIEVKGEVNAPGVYKLAYQSTINDAIKAAKGFKENANSDAINLNQIVSANDVIVVGTINQAITSVSLNSATLEQLMTLKGVGPSTAQKIVDYRNENGSFKAIEEIMNVKGIKQKMFDRIKDSITL